jgi:hypothetical protein
MEVCVYEYELAPAFAGACDKAVVLHGTHAMPFCVRLKKAFDDRFAAL